MNWKVLLYSLFSLILTSNTLFLNGCTPPSEGDEGVGQARMEMQIPVVGFKAKRQPIAEKISLVGNLEANEIIEVKSEIEGAVKEIKFAEGQKVKKGDLLFLIDQRKLKAALAQAEANFKLAETTSQRYQSLTETRAISRQEFEQASAALEINQATVELNRAQLNDSTILAPFDGVMGERLISVGQVISKGTSLGFLINQDPIKANFRIPERYLSRVKEGQRIEISVAAYPDENFLGEIYFISPQIDELTRTALIKAKLSNPEGKLRQGMFANLQLAVNQKKDALVIPETAIMLKGDQALVFTVDQENVAQIKPVKTGIRLAGVVEVTEGILEGETVVAEGFQKLAPGAKAAVRYEDETEAAPAPASEVDNSVAQIPIENDLEETQN